MLRESEDEGIRETLDIKEEWEIAEDNPSQKVKSFKDESAGEYKTRYNAENIKTQNLAKIIEQFNNKYPNECVSQG